MRWRVVLISAGAALALYGVFRIVSQPEHSTPWSLAVWLAGGVALHDGVLAPLTIGVAWILARAIRPRARRYVQFALVWCGLVAVVALPLIALRGSQPAVKALENQNYAAHLGVLVAGISVVVGLAYLVRVARDRRAQRVNETNSRPSIDQDSASS